MKNLKVLMYSVGLLILAGLLMMGYGYTRHNLNFTCSSSNSSFHNNAESTPFLTFSQNISFTRSGAAFLYISGNIENENKYYSLNRAIIYDYRRIGPDEYLMEVTKASRSGGDNIPAELENKYLMPLLSGVQRIIRIRQLPNGNMVFANNAGPFLICAVH